ncbi:unnamed protein product [Echinostoma caproni]|uniref:MATH domain-containing protein n=1 Tax=Echinostoma caproni TaxID=27848 RepID=A0A183B927_9TREM|nr:unnamed protein product [Echinostoma caproni]
MEYNEVNANELDQNPQTSEVKSKSEDCHICSKLFELARQNEAFKNMVDRQQELCNDLIKLYTLLQNSARNDFDPADRQPGTIKPCPTVSARLPSRSVRIEPSILDPIYPNSQCKTCAHEFMKKLINDHSVDLKVVEQEQQPCLRCYNQRYNPCPNNYPVSSTFVHCPAAVHPDWSISSADRTNTVKTEAWQQKHNSPSVQTYGPVFSPHIENGCMQQVEEAYEIHAPIHSNLCATSSSKNFRCLEKQNVAPVKGCSSLENVNKQGNAYIWTINSYCAIEAAECGFWSEPFYLGEPGYRFRAKIEFTTFHMGIFIQLLPGEYDDSLQWPFRCSIQFVLIDQTMSGRNLSRILKPFPEDEDERGVWDRPRPDDWSSVMSESNRCTIVGKTDAWGLPDFAPRSLLGGPKPHGRNDYVRNDRMYVAIRLV